MKKILLFTTMALTLVVSAFCFSFIKVGANSDVLDNVFAGAKTYEYNLTGNDISSNIYGLTTIVDYYNDIMGSNPRYNDDYSLVINNGYADVDVWSEEVGVSQYYCQVIIPNVPISKSFVYLFTNTVGVNIYVLYQDFTWDYDEPNDSGNLFEVPSDKNVIAIAFRQYNGFSECSKITISSDEILSSIYYEQGKDSGYDIGYSVGVSDTQTYYEGQINILNNTIAGLQAQIDTLNANNVNLTFKDTLNNILSYPVKLIRRVFYNDQPVLDELGNPVVDAYGNVQYETTTPIELFGVSLPGLVLGLFSIAMTFGLVAIVKKVWR